MINDCFLNILACFSLHIYQIANFSAQLQLHAHHQFAQSVKYAHHHQFVHQHRQLSALNLSLYIMLNHAVNHRVHNSNQATFMAVPETAMLQSHKPIHSRHNLSIHHSKLQHHKVCQSSTIAVFTLLPFLINFFIIFFEIFSSVRCWTSTRTTILTEQR